MKHQQSTQSESDADPPESSVGLSKNHPPNDGLETHTQSRQHEGECFHYNFFLSARTSLETSETLTEETKLDAVVVTVALAEEELCWRALEKKVHMTVLQVMSRPPHSSRRGTWSWKQQ